MFKPRHKKKTDTLEVRMPHDTKRAFIEAARAEGRTASDVVRDAIDDYLRRAARRRSSLSDRSIAMILNTPAARRSALAASAAAIGLTAIAVSPSTAEIDLQAVFERMDANGDGRVTFEEFSDHSPTPGPGGGMMVVRTVERTETDGEVVVGEGELWIPAAPDRDEAMALLEDVDVETDGAHEYRVVRRVRIEEDGETEDYVELDTSDGASFDVTAHLAAMREEEFGRFDADGDGAVDFAEF
ncbi:MAG: EF-hand domain-containing protein, partial [Maricaulaceae bacterium]